MTDKQYRHCMLAVIGVALASGAFILVFMDPSVGTKQGYACGCVDYEAPWLGSRP